MRFVSLGANIAVVVGLIFVGLEVGNGRAAAEAQAADGIADGFLQINLITISDSTMARIATVGRVTPDSLSDIDAIRYSMYLRAVFNQYHRVHRLYQSGLIPEEDWGLYAREVAALLDAPGGRLYVEGNEFSEQFLADVEPYAGGAPNIDLRLGRDARAP